MNEFVVLSGVATPEKKRLGFERVWFLEQLQPGDAQVVRIKEGHQPKNALSSAHTAVRTARKKNPSFRFNAWASDANGGKAVISEATHITVKREA